MCYKEGKSSIGDENDKMMSTATLSELPNDQAEIAPGY